MYMYYDAMHAMITLSTYVYRANMYVMLIIVYVVRCTYM
jgi:hypothetical protein